MIKCVTMWVLNLCLLLFLFPGLQFAEQKAERSVGKDWNYLIFTQHWPPTVCVDYIEEHPSRWCSMPVTPDSWTIHGIWPTKVRTLGPQYCNNTWFFDPEEVKPIESELEQLWRNIEGGTELYELWDHEWTKHGTCAASIEPLNTQLKYFTRGIDWIKQFSMSRILALSNINPSDDKVYTLNDFYNAVKENLGVEPQIECRSERGGKQYLFEIRLCFTKDMELVDCSVVYHFNINGSTNCMPTPGITYPATYSAPHWLLIQMYRLSSFLQWYTL